MFFEDHSLKTYIYVQVEFIRTFLYYNIESPRSFWDRAR